MTETFTPDYAVHPGLTLKESLDRTGMSQSDLAERSGLSRKTINGIINGRESVSHDTALLLEKVFRVPARFWVGLQSNFDAADARHRERARLEASRDWIRDTGIPYPELVKRGLVRDTRDPVARLEEVLRFFGVATPEAFEAVWQDCRKACAFRKSEKAASRFGAIAAWLRQGELEAEQINCAPFDKSRLRATLGDLRASAPLPLEDVVEGLVSHLAECGAALVFTPTLRGAPIHGATRWITPRRALVQLSIRGRDDGNFWFTLFHEIAHLLLHDKRDVFLEIDGDEYSGGDTEEEANAFARELLIPQARLDAFLDRHPTHRIPKAAIRAFAKELALPPGVVVGRLQWDKTIPFTRANDLKRRFVLSEAGS
jgi:addiction module HigA family antidote